MSPYSELLQLLTPDAPPRNRVDWQSWHDWFCSLLPADAAWMRRVAVEPDEVVDQRIDVEWTVGRRRWHVLEIGLWYQIQDGGLLHITTPKGEAYPLRRVVALLRILEALPPASPAFRITNETGTFVLGADDG